MDLPVPDHANKTMVDTITARQNNRYVEDYIRDSIEFEDDVEGNIASYEQMYAIGMRDETIPSDKANDLASMMGYMDGWTDNYAAFYGDEMAESMEQVLSFFGSLDSPYPSPKRLAQAIWGLRGDLY